jgi:TolB protein
MDSYAFAHSSPVWIGEVGSVDDGAALRSAGILLPALLGARASLERAYRGVEIPNLLTRFDEAQGALEAWLGRADPNP